ncbi:hypothetical protein CVT24_011443 [Panaeolus cyanescens]|uniref:Metaxin glutathione S-transferase domain-containing protein n=1 Tax=Panaeolus cyanescens TaxID=181874 RepID=A0A409VGF8_9AGAR|nr:hypothetical protein CVT24_011443 [Panaeolus cyanescens]
MAAIFKPPSAFVSLTSRFPLKTYPEIKRSDVPIVVTPTLWIHPPRSVSQTSDSVLSADVECLKWQAYLALRGLTGIELRRDIAPEGCINGTLPNLHVPSDDVLIGEEELLAAQSIPAWVDKKLGVDSTADPLEGYKDQSSRVESRAWISLLEGVVHAALMLSQPSPSFLHSLIFPSSTTPLNESLQKVLAQPPAPLTGLSSIIPPMGTRVNTSTILSQYKDAITSLSERLGTDKWFLGSSEPTPLDALAFAYLHCILHVDHSIRTEVTRWVNLVAWEWKVRCIVRDGFVH